MFPARKFHIPPGHDAKRWIRELLDRYSVQEGRVRDAKSSFYDTFDWRLFHRSLVLVASGNKLFLSRYPLSRLPQNLPPPIAFQFCGKISRNLCPASTTSKRPAQAYPCHGSVEFLHGSIELRVFSPCSGCDMASFGNKYLQPFQGPLLLRPVQAVFSVRCPEDPR